MGTVRNRPDGRLYLDFRDSIGRRIRESVHTSNKKLAEQILKKREVEVLEGKFFDKKRSEKVLFGNFANEVLKYCLERRKAKNYFVTKIKQLNKHFGGKYLNEISTRDVIDYQEERSHQVLKSKKTSELKQISKSTVNRELSVLRRIFNLGIKWGRISNNPVKGVDFFKEPSGRTRYLMQEEITRLVSNCYGNIRNIVKVALLTGMRKEEILGLRWGNIDFENNLIILDKTKNGEVRQIPCAREVREILWQLSTGKRNDEFVFVKSDGKRFRDIRTQFKTALRRAGIEEFRFHDLRHTFASQLVMSGADLLVVKSLLGHKDISMTMRYAHLAPKYQEEAIYKLESKLQISTKKEILGHDLGKLLNEGVDTKQNDSKSIENINQIVSGPVAQMDRAEVS